MKFLYKLERKFGRYAINNLSAYMVGCFVIGYLLWAFLPKVYDFIIFDVACVFSGHEYWRLFTWIFTMPGPLGIMSILFLFFNWSIGMSTERAVGTFMYNIYVFGAVILVTICMFINGYVEYNNMPETFDMLYQSREYMGGYSQTTLEMLSAGGPTNYLNISVFLAFALMHSDAVMLFMFILPVKATWLAAADLIYMIYLYAFGYNSLVPSRGIIIAIIVNFLVFYFVNNEYRHHRRPISKVQRRQRKEFRTKVREIEIENKLKEGQARHKCAICGKTELDDENLEFRYCSRCKGNYEYCNEHLFTHEHVK